MPGHTVMPSLRQSRRTSRNSSPAVRAVEEGSPTPDARRSSDNKKQSTLLSFWTDDAQNRSPAASKGENGAERHDGLDEAASRGAYTPSKLILTMNNHTKKKHPLPSSSLASSVVVTPADTPPVDQQENLHPAKRQKTADIDFAPPVVVVVPEQADNQEEEEEQQQQQQLEEAASTPPLISQPSTPLTQTSIAHEFSETPASHTSKLIRSDNQVLRYQEVLQTALEDLEKNGQSKYAPILKDFFDESFGDWELSEVLDTIILGRANAEDKKVFFDCLLKHRERHRAQRRQTRIKNRIDRIVKSSKKANSIEESDQTREHNSSEDPLPLPPPTEEPEEPSSPVNNLSDNNPTTPHANSPSPASAPEPFASTSNSPLPKENSLPPANQDSMPRQKPKSRASRASRKASLAEINTSGRSTRNTRSTRSNAAPPVSTDPPAAETSTEDAQDATAPVTPLDIPDTTAITPTTPNQTRPNLRSRSQSSSSDLSSVDERIVEGGPPASLGVNSKRMAAEGSTENFIDALALEDALPPPPAKFDITQRKLDARRQLDEDLEANQGSFARPNTIESRSSRHLPSAGRSTRSNARGTRHDPDAMDVDQPDTLAAALAGTPYLAPPDKSFKRAKGSRTKIS
jgi:hypothetical protein